MVGERGEILEQMTPRGSASISNFACHGWDQSVCDSKEEMKRQIMNGEGRREEKAYLWITLTSCLREKVAAEADTIVCGDERLFTTLGRIAQCLNGRSHGWLEHSVQGKAASWIVWEQRRKYKDGAKVGNGSWLQIKMEWTQKLLAACVSLDAQQYPSQVQQKGSPSF